MKVAVLTSGGDCPGMNPAIRGVARCALSKGATVVGILDGWRGLVNKQFVPIEWHSVGRIIHRGGTILGTARYPEFKKCHVRQVAADILRESNIDGLVVIGGDGSLTGGLRLWQETGFPVVGIPATIDNDLCHTDLSLGVDTALNLGVQVLDRLRDTAASHERVFVVEMFGNRSGYLAALCGLAAGAARVLVPEKRVQPDDLDTLARHISQWYATMARKRNHIESARHVLVVVAEGADFAHFSEHYLDPDLEKVRDVRRRIEQQRTGGECRAVVLTYTQRGGSPSARDRILGTRFGAEAVELLLKDRAGIMVALDGDKIVSVELAKVIKDTEHLQHEPSYNLHSRHLGKLLDLQEKLGQLSPTRGQPSKKLLLITSGADAPGMNLYIRALARLACLRGWSTYGAQHGFSLLIKNQDRYLDEEIFESLSWEVVHMGAMIATGGSLLGSERTERLTPEEGDVFWRAIESRQFDGVVVLGGIHAFGICAQLAEHDHGKPLFFLPATISNNIPGTTMCIGADTALNNLMGVIDKAKDTGISLQRIHIIQVMGRTCGWLALQSALAGGAEAVFDVETGLSVEKIVNLANDLRCAFGDGGATMQKTGIILLNERAADTLSAESIREMLEQMTRRTTRVLNPSQMQRGGPPSAFDRILACQLSQRTIEELENANQKGDTGGYLVGWKSGTTQIMNIRDAYRDLDSAEGALFKESKQDHKLLQLTGRRP